MIKSIFFLQPALDPARYHRYYFNLLLDHDHKPIPRPFPSSHCARIFLNLKESSIFLFLYSQVLFCSPYHCPHHHYHPDNREGCVDFFLVFLQVPVDLLKCSFVHCSSPHSSVDTLTSRWICLKRRRHVYLYVSSFTSQSGWIVKMKIIPLHSQSRIFF